NFSGQLYRIIPYGVDERTERIDYDVMARLANEHRPKIIVSGATAYPRTFDFPRLRAICDDVGALMMVDMAHFAGLVAGKARRDRQPPGPARRTGESAHGTEGREGAGRRAHHREQEHDPLRPGEADDHQRDPHRDPRDDHPGDGPRGDAAHRGVDRRGAARSR